MHDATMPTGSSTVAQPAEITSGVSSKLRSTAYERNDAGNADTLDLKVVIACPRGWLKGKSYVGAATIWLFDVHINQIRALV